MIDKHFFEQIFLKVEPESFLYEFLNIGDQLYQQLANGAASLDSRLCMAEGNCTTFLSNFVDKTQILNLIHYQLAGSMPLSLGGYIINVTIYVYSRLYFYVLPYPSDLASRMIISSSSLTDFSKRLTMCTNVFSHEHTELPTSSLLQAVGAPLHCTAAVFSLAQQLVGIPSQVT